jgi:hypothetical protein
MLGQSGHWRAWGLVWLLSACSSPAVEGLQARDPDAETARPEAVRDVTASDYAARVDLLALGYADGHFEVRSPAPQHVLSRGKHEAPILNVALSPDGRLLASADANGNVAVSEIETGSYGILPKLPHAQGKLSAVGLAWDAHGKRLVIAAGVDLRVIEPETGASQERSFPKPANAVVFTPDGKQLIVAGTQLSFLDASSLEPMRSSSPPGPAGGKNVSPVLNVRFSPDGQWLGVLYTDRVVLENQQQGTAQVASLAEMSAVGLRFAMDGRVAIFGRRALYVGPPSSADIPAGLRKTAGALWDVQFRQDGSLMFVGDTADAELASVLE